MPILEMKYLGASVLTREAKPIKNINGEIIKLANDMLETMYHFRGVGLAAPQVGVSKRLIIVDCGRDYQKTPYIFLNPQVIHAEGSQIGLEGCLSLPDVYLEVERPYKIVVQAINLQGQKIEVVGEELLARAILHEIDHLDGRIFTEQVIDQDAWKEEQPKLKERIQQILAGEISAVIEEPEEAAVAI